MNQYNYNVDDTKPVKYHLYLIGLIVFGFGIAGLPFGLQVIAHSADNSNGASMGKLLICIGLGCTYALATMIVHFFYRIHMHHKYNRH